MYSLFSTKKIFEKKEKETKKFIFWDSLEMKRSYAILVATGVNMRPWIIITNLSYFEWLMIGLGHKEELKERLSLKKSYSRPATIERSWR